jgi:flagellar basal body-associated protein FliL
MNNDPFNQPPAAPAPNPPTPAPQPEPSPLTAQPASMDFQPQPQPQPQIQPQAAPTAAPAPAPAQPKKSKLGLIIGIIIAAVILIGGGVTAAILLLADTGPKDEDYRKAYVAITDFAKKQPNLEKLSQDAFSEAQYAKDPSSLDEYSKQFGVYVTNFRTMMNNIEATGILKDEVLKEKYDRLKTSSDKVLPAFEKLIPELIDFATFYKGFEEKLLPHLGDQQWLMGGSLTEELIDEIFGPIMNSNSTPIQQFAAETSAMYKNVAATVKSYNNKELTAAQFQSKMLEISSDASKYLSNLADLFSVEALMGVTEEELNEFEAAATDFSKELYSRFPADDDLELPANIEIFGERT